jgi:hypothetical protein
MKLELIHYGHDKFDITKFDKIENTNWIKPKGGLWASPINSKWGWKDWCESENYCDLSCYFIFNYSGNILVINSKNSLNKLPFYNPDISYKFIFAIDFEKLSKEYDAILLTEQGQKETHFSLPKNLCGWDCESICIFNPKGIII